MKTSEEIVKLLTPWKECYLILDKATDALVSVGFEPEAPIIEAAWKAFDALTARLEAELGDERETLDWFAHENRMGARGHQAGLLGDLSHPNAGGSSVAPDGSGAGEGRLLAKGSSRGRWGCGMSAGDVTAEEMEQAIENARTAVFRDPPWSPNARAFLAILTERDRLASELAQVRGDESWPARGCGASYAPCLGARVGRCGMSAQATPEEIAFVVADAQTWPDAYVARRVVLHLAGEVAALRRQVEERGDAAPAFDVNRLDGLEGAWAEGNLRVYIAGARAGWEKCASLIRIPPGEVVATPPPDVVTVPREEWAVAQILSNAWRRHPLTCSERDKLLTEWDALRSGEAGNKDGAST